jgi:hypothetical protein
MTIQEAYNKGLDDAEAKVSAALQQILFGEDSEPFPNVVLDALCLVVKERSDYYVGLSKRNNNVGKFFRKSVAAQTERIDNSRK